MAIPAYLWLKDDGGADIKGSVDIYGREGSIEIIALNHGIMQPTDKHNGKATSLRIHSPYSFDKEIDASSPYLYKAVSTGQKLKSAEIKFYRINDAGQEVEYFSTLSSSPSAARASTSRATRSRHPKCGRCATSTSRSCP